MAEINNVEERSLALLAGQFQGTNPDGSKKNIQKLIGIFSSTNQEIQDVILSLKNDRNIFTSVGVQLDGIGEILGLARLSGELDEDYRERLKFQVFINNGSGTPEEVIAILKFLTNATEIIYIEFYPAAYQMSSDGDEFPIPIEELVEGIQKASPASVQYVPITLTYGVDVPFVFSPDFESKPLWVTDPDDPATLVNLELDSTEILYVNPAESTTSERGGGFAEALGTYPTYTIDTTGAGQLAEVIMFNGSQAPAP